MLKPVFKLISVKKMCIENYKIDIVQENFCENAYTYKFELQEYINIIKDRSVKNNSFTDYLLIDE